jgi:glycosyltransferase involved in cell wall biosynthesis
LEYAALGVPSIVSRTMAVRTYFDDSMVKFFKPGDVDDLACCILELYRDRAQLAQLGCNIRKFNQQYNWPKQSQAYLQLLDRLGNSYH